VGDPTSNWRVAYKPIQIHGCNIEVWDGSAWQLFNDALKAEILAKNQDTVLQWQNGIHIADAELLGLTP
jgi:hypothetical protein